MSSSLAAGQRDGGPRTWFWPVLLTVTVLLGCVYVGFRLSPSSYGIVLRELGVPGEGLVAGVPRVERGDEYAWQTPLLQMTVRSGFGRYDKTPPYFEDLRGLYAMPILDWMLPFKPQFWGFFLLPASFAYSLYHYVLIAMFVIGFTALFVRLGGRPIDSLLMALALFFSSFTQYWWDGSSNFLFPFFPWIVLALLWEFAFVLRLGLLFWLLSAGLLTYFYPPNAIALGFVAVVLWAVARPEIFHWRRLIPVGLVAAASVGIIAFYLRDALAALATTSYPGQRISTGGDVGFWWWLTQFLPASQMHHHVTLNGTNICEASTVGSIFALVVLICFPWKDALVHHTRQERRTWLLLGAGVLATQAWMTLPLPAWVGYPLLWHRVPPGRMVLAGGVLLMVLTFVLSQSRPLRFTTGRIAIATAIVLAAWAHYKEPAGIGLLAAYKDWLVLVPVVVLAELRAKDRIAPAIATTALLVSALGIGFLSFGRFNPLQSTAPIFNTPDAPVLRTFDEELRQQGHGYVMRPWGSSFFAYAGMPLIALGYPAMSINTFVPALDLWRKVYPELTADEMQTLFNNAGSLAFGEVEKPQRVPGTLLTLAPIAPFTRPGATVCDFVPPSRAWRAAGSVCASPLAGGGIEP